MRIDVRPGNAAALACPFCESCEFLQVEEFSRHCVVCACCDAQGPTAVTETEAVTLWNEAPRKTKGPVSGPVQR